MSCTNKVIATRFESTIWNNNVCRKWNRRNSTGCICSGCIHPICLKPLTGCYETIDRDLDGCVDLLHLTFFQWQGVGRDRVFLRCALGFLSQWHSIYFGALGTWVGCLGHCAGGNAVEFSRSSRSRLRVCSRHRWYCWLVALVSAQIKCEVLRPRSWVPGGIAPNLVENIDTFRYP